MSPPATHSPAEYSADIDFYVSPRDPPPSAPTRKGWRTERPPVPRTIGRLKGKPFIYRRPVSTTLLGDGALFGVLDVKTTGSRHWSEIGSSKSPSYDLLPMAR